jgi:hypothetical protein
LPSSFRSCKEEFGAVCHLRCYEGGGEKAKQESGITKRTKRTKRTKKKENFG